MDTSDRAVYTSYYDTQDPTVTGIEGSTATVGSAKRFTASVSDNYSVGSDLNYSWDFGDGGSGTGQTASHTYSSAGEYTVTVSVEDQAGNSSDIYTDTVTVSEAEVSNPEPSVEYLSSSEIDPFSSAALQPSTVTAVLSSGQEVTLDLRKARVKVAKYRKKQKSKYLSVAVKGIEMSCNPSPCQLDVRAAIQVTRKSKKSKRSRKTKLFRLREKSVTGSVEIDKKDTLKFKISSKNGRKLYRYLKTKKYFKPTFRLAVGDFSTAVDIANDGKIDLPSYIAADSSKAKVTFSSGKGSKKKSKKKSRSKKKRS